MILSMRKSLHFAVFFKPLFKRSMIKEKKECDICFLAANLRLRDTFVLLGKESFYRFNKESFSVIEEQVQVQK